jgi:hypothetical protein
MRIKEKLHCLASLSSDNEYRHQAESYYLLASHIGYRFRLVFRSWA